MGGSIPSWPTSVSNGETGNVAVLPATWGTRLTLFCLYGGMVNTWGFGP